MSLAAKTTFLLSTTFTCSIVYYVHRKQRTDREVIKTIMQLLSFNYQLI